MSNASQHPPLETVETTQRSFAAAPRALRAQAVQRLQVGLFGLALMLLLVGLANIIMEHARMNDAASGQASSARAASSGDGGASDPLADIGIIPSPDPDAAAKNAGTRSPAAH